MQHTIAVSRAPQPEWLAENHGAISDLIAFVVRWTALSACFYVIGWYLYQHGFISLNLIFFAEKARLAIDGAPPRLVNIGFVYPPLSFILMLPFRNPVLAQAFISGGIFAAIFRFFDRRIESAMLRRLAKCYMLISPLFLYVAVEDYGLLLIAVLLALVTFYLGRYLDYEYSLYLFSAGTLYGLTFFIDFRSIYLLALFVPAVFIPLVRRSLPQAISVTLAMGIPICFMAGAWIYVNWIFLGDGFAFVHGPSSFFRSFSVNPNLLAVSGNLWLALVYSLRIVLFTLPITCAYFVGLFLLRSQRAMFLIPTLAVYCSPLVLLGTSVYSGVFAPSVAVLIFFQLILFYELSRMRKSALLPIALVVSLLASFAAPFFSPNADERTFAQTIVTGTVRPNLREFEEVARALRPTRGRILIDDAVFYPVVFLGETPKRFILPYEYEFETAVADPRLLASYVVSTRMSSGDLISSVHPKIAYGILKGFKPFAYTKHYIIMQRLEQGQSRA